MVLMLLLFALAACFASLRASLFRAEADYLTAARIEDSAAGNIACAALYFALFAARTATVSN